MFTHKSLFGKPASMVDDVEDPQDWERVAFLGEGILLAAMSSVLYYAYPRRRTSALKVSGFTDSSSVKNCLESEDLQLSFFGISSWYIASTNPAVIEGVARIDNGRISVHGKA